MQHTGGWFEQACHILHVALCYLLQQACSQFMELLQRCVFAPLGAHVSKARPVGHPEQQALQADSTDEEDFVMVLLERSVAKLHWSAALCMVR
jgi:hypothetical protein